MAEPRILEFSQYGSPMTPVFGDAKIFQKFEGNTACIPAE